MTVGTIQWAVLVDTQKPPHLANSPPLLTFAQATGLDWSLTRKPASAMIHSQGKSRWPLWNTLSPAYRLCSPARTRHLGGALTTLRAFVRASPQRAQWPSTRRDLHQTWAPALLRWTAVTTNSAALTSLAAAPSPARKKLVPITVWCARSFE